MAKNLPAQKKGVNQAVANVQAPEHPQLSPAIADFLAEAGYPVAPGAFVDIGDLDALAQRFRMADQADLALQIWRGANLHALSQERKGEYRQFLARIGLPASTAHGLTSVFLKARELKASSSLKALALIDGSKRVEIARWDASEIEAFTSGKEVRGVTLETAEELRYRDFVQKIRESDAEAERLRGQVEGLERERDALRRAVSNAKSQAADRARQSGLPAFAFAARQETAAASAQLELGLNLLKDVVHDRLGCDEAAADQRNAAKVAVAAFASLNAAAADIAALLKQLRQEFPEETAGAVEPFRFSKPEAEAAKDARELLFTAAAEAAHDRDAQRANEAQGRKGRKREMIAKKKAR
jgi:hypothetical protein